MGEPNYSECGPALMAALTNIELAVRTNRGVTTDHDAYAGLLHALALAARSGDSVAWLKFRDARFGRYGEKYPLSQTPSALSEARAAYLRGDIP